MSNVTSDIKSKIEEYKAKEEDRTGKSRDVPVPVTTLVGKTIKVGAAGHSHRVITVSGGRLITIHEDGEIHALDPSVDTMTLDPQTERSIEAAQATIARFEPPASPEKQPTADVVDPMEWLRALTGVYVSCDEIEFKSGGDQGRGVSGAMFADALRSAMRSDRNPPPHTVTVAGSKVSFGVIDKAGPQRPAASPDENLSAVLQGRMSLADLHKSPGFAEMAKEATMREVVGSAATASWIMTGTTGGVNPRAADGMSGSGGGGGGGGRISFGAVTPLGDGNYFVPLPDEVLTTTGKKTLTPSSSGFTVDPTPGPPGRPKREGNDADEHGRPIRMRAEECAALRLPDPGMHRLNHPAAWYRHGNRIGRSIADMAPDFIETEHTILDLAMKAIRTSDVLENMRVTLAEALASSLGVPLR